jgi:hypothetical protein
MATSNESQHEHYYGFLCGYRDRLDREINATGIVVAFFGVNRSRVHSSVREPTVLK